MYVYISYICICKSSRIDVYIRYHIEARVHFIHIDVNWPSTSIKKIIYPNLLLLNICNLSGVYKCLSPFLDSLFFSVNLFIHCYLDISLSWLTSSFIISLEIIPTTLLFIEKRSTNSNYLLAHISVGELVISWSRLGWSEQLYSSCG